MRYSEDVCGLWITLNGRIPHIVLVACLLSAHEIISVQRESMDSIFLVFTAGVNIDAGRLLASNLDIPIQSGMRSKQRDLEKDIR